MGWPMIAAAGIAAGSGLLGGLVQGQQQKQAAKREYEYQKEFAQHGIRWKVADAKAAGIHPLAALGSNTLSYSPQRIGASDYGISRFGQDISRALAATKTKEEKMSDQIDLQFKREQLNHMQLQNLGLLQEIEKNNKPSIPTLNGELGQKFGIVGQDDAARGFTVLDLSSKGGFKFVPTEVPYSQSLGFQTGIVPLEQYAINKDGTLYETPSEKLQETMESDFFTQAKYVIGKGIDYATQWGYYLDDRNPKAGDHRMMLRHRRPAAPKGYRYLWNPWRGSYVLRKFDGMERLYDVPKNHGMARYIH